MSLIKNHFEISQYKTDSWVLETATGHFYISDLSKQLLDILKKSRSVQEAATAFNNTFNFNLNEKAFVSFINKNLGFTGLLATTSEPVLKQKSFIKFQFTIFKAQTAAILAKPFKPLFNKSFFWIACTGLFLLALYTLFFREFESDTISVKLVMFLYFITIVLHELGHIAVCKRFTGKNGEIGAGLYLIFPVLYSNISALWHASKLERVIGNLAGVYMQLWCLLLCFGYLYFYPKNGTVNEMAYMLALYSLIQLLPFIRSDGYWLLSDLTSTPNLLKKSNETGKLFFTHTKLFFRKEDFSKNIGLLFYAAFNTLLIFYFVVYQLFLKWEEVLAFPQYIWEIILQLIQLEIPDFKTQYISILIVYILVFRYLQRALKAIFKPKTSKKDHTHSD